MKAFRFLLAALLSACLLAVPAWATDIEPGTGRDFFVRDTANVLSSDTEDTIIDYNAALEEQCSGAQLVVVTVSYLDGDADIAATRLMNDWGVGDAAQSNGMLLLLVANEHRGWLTVGAGLDRDFTGEMADEYLEDYFWDDVDRDRFDDAVQSLTAQLYDWYMDYYDVQADAYSGGPMPEPLPAGDTQTRTGAGGFLSAVFVIIVLVLILWIVGAASRFSRMRRWGYGGGFFPIFWFGGGRRYRTYRNQFRPQPPPPPPGGFGGSTPPPPRRTTSFHSSRPTGGFTRGVGGGRSSGGFHSGGFHGGGGGHSGGGGGGRR